MAYRPHLNPEREHTEIQGNLSFFGDQILLVDPQYQAYGLQGRKSMDDYANKFFIGSEPNGFFISPNPISPEIHEYYRQIGLPVAPSENCYHFPAQENEDTSLTNRLGTEKSLLDTLQATGKYLIPYLVTPETENLAKTYGLPTLVDVETADYLADKAQFQALLQELSPEIKNEFGWNVGIKHRLVSATNQTAVQQVYDEISKNGQRDIVVVKPKSAAGKGVYFVRAQDGWPVVERLLQHGVIEEDELILIEEAVEHTESPSFQGFQQPGQTYTAHYSGKQDISIHYDQDGVGMNSYDSNRVPFGIEADKIDPQELARLHQVHEIIVQTLFTTLQAQGIAGLDSVIKLHKGKVQTLKYTELNMHFPGSFAVHAAIEKLFPNGFDGVAHNQRYELDGDQAVYSFADFMKANRSYLIRQPGEYGIFPLPSSYSMAVDLLIVGANLREVHDFSHRILGVKSRGPHR